MTLQNRVLAGLLALQAAVLIVVFWPGSSGPGIEQLFPGLQEVNVTGVTITDSEGRSIRLARSPFGCVLPDAGDYPCQQNKLPQFLNRIVPITTVSLVTETKASHARLKVADDDFERFIELELADGKRHRFFLGTSSRGRSAHARLEGQDQVYLAPGFSASDASVQAAAWVDPVYFSVPQDQVVALTLENGNGQLLLQKEESGDWKLDGVELERSLDQVKAQAMVNAAASLRMLRPLGKEESEAYGLGDPAAVLTFRTKEGESDTAELVIRIGAKDDLDEGFVVKSSESPYYVVMAGATAQDFIDKEIDSLLESPPEGTPEAST